jgi:hypothetical protein
LDFEIDLLFPSTLRLTSAKRALSSDFQSTQRYSSNRREKIGLRFDDRAQSPDRRVYAGAHCSRLIKHIFHHSGKTKNEWK